MLVGIGVEERWNEVMKDMGYWWRDFRRWWRLF